MEGDASVITGAHLFQRGSPRSHAGRSFSAFFSLSPTAPAQLRFWASEADRQSGAPPMGTVKTADISGVRVASPRRAGAQGEWQLQFELRLPDNKQRMVRLVPADGEQCQRWAAALGQSTRGRHSAATSIAGAATTASEGWRGATVEKEGLLYTPYLGAGVADEPAWLAVKVRVERRGGEGRPSYVLRYGTAEAADVRGERGGGLSNAETIGMRAVHSVRFGFGGPGVRAAMTETMPGDKTVDRKSCHFQFSIADTALDGAEQLQQVASAADAQVACSPWRRRQQPPLPLAHGPADRVLRLRTRTTRECIEWVNFLRKLSVDRLLYPELLPLGVQRLLRAVFHRALRNADGTVKEAELGRQLQRDRVLSTVLPEEFRALPAATLETEDAAMAAVEAAAVAAWLFDGEDAAHEVLADAVAAAALAGDTTAGEGGFDGTGHIQASVQASYSYNRSMTLETFVHEMNSRHHAALETAAAPYLICTASEALAKLRSDFELHERLEPAGAVKVVAERLRLPHEPVVDEALVLIFAHLGQRVVLVPPEDPSSSKTVAMDGLMRAINADAAAAAGGGAAADGAAFGQGHRSTSLVDYDELDDDDHETSQSPSRLSQQAASPRPYGSYRRSRRTPMPSPRQQQQEQSVQAAMLQRQQERGGAGGLGMVPSMNARLTLALRQSPRHSTSELSESEEIALVLTPTDTYRHLPHEQQKEKRKTDFEEMMATAAAQAEETTADKSGLLAAGPAGREQRAQARREAEEKRRTNSEELAQKHAQAAAARTALAAARLSSPGHTESASAPMAGGAGAAGGGDWSSRVGVGSSAAMVLAKLGL